MPRQARRKSESGIYHVMMRGINHQQIFYDTDDREKFLSLFREGIEQGHYLLLGYCLMGNHVHLLIQEQNESLEQIFKRIGSKYVYWYNVKYQRSGHLFQDRFKSEPVDDDRYLMAVIRYIHQNPIKAGLCKKLEEYPYSSYTAYQKPNSFVSTDLIFSILSPDQFVAFHEELSNDSCMDIDLVIRNRMTDEQVSQSIKRMAKIDSITEFPAIDPVKRKRYLTKLYENGASIRQLSRLTGLSKGMIERTIK